jgi:hypothetical protein
MADSRCIYCASKYYGKPCLYSPNKTHVHFDNPGKCIFCGSKSVGTGCPYNPFGKVHVRGADFLANVKEQVEKSTILSYLYENISKISESTVISPLNRFYKRLASIIGNSGEPILEALQLQHTPSYVDLTKDQNIFVFEMKERLKKQYSDINESLKHANASLPAEVVERLLLDVIISSSENI